MAQGPPFVLYPSQDSEGQQCLVVPTRAVSAEARSKSLVFGMSVEKESKDAELGFAVSKEGVSSLLMSLTQPSGR